MRKLALLFLLFVGPPAMAQEPRTGPAPVSPSRPALVAEASRLRHAFAVDPSRLALVAESSRLRHAFGVGPSGTLATLQQPPAALLELTADAVRFRAAQLLQDAPLPAATPEGAVSAALAGLDSDGRLLLASVWSESAQRVGLRGNVALVGWWHPLLDTWTLTRWRHGAAGWELEEMGFAPLGEGAAPWWDDAPTLADALRLRAIRAAQRFDAIAAAAPQGALDPGVRSRDEMLRHNWLRLHNLRAAVPAHRDRLRRLLVTDTGALRGDPAVREHLLRLPAQVRQSLRPTGLFERSDGPSYLIQSPIDPAMALFVHVARGADGIERPMRLDVTRLDF